MPPTGVPSGTGVICGRVFDAVNAMTGNDMAIPPNSVCSKYCSIKGLKKIRLHVVHYYENCEFYTAKNTSFLFVPYLHDKLSPR